MTEIGAEIEQYHNSYPVYAGGALRRLGDARLVELAEQVSMRLAENPYTMINYKPEELVKSINEGRAAAILDHKGKLAAFAQYWPYKIDNTGDEFLNEKNTHPEVYEVGTWLKFAQNGERELGKKVFEACLAVGRMAHPHAMFIGVVEEGNSRAAGSIESMGGVYQATKISKHVKTDRSHPARMKIFEMIRPEAARPGH